MKNDLAEYRALLEWQEQHLPSRDIVLDKKDDLILRLRNALADCLDKLKRS